MITTRRGFLAALIAAPVLARMAPAVPNGRVLHDMLEGGPRLKANVWAVRPSPTEADIIRFMDAAQRWELRGGPVYLIASPQWRKEIAQL